MLPTIGFDADAIVCAKIAEYAKLPYTNSVTELLKQRDAADKK
jgi:hypothetical protein